MRTTLLALTALATLHLSTASQTPGLYADPDTIPSCVEWYDNSEGLTCKELRDYFTITPEQFTEWNPSVSLDCEPWNEWQSYCIVTQERLDDTASSLSASASATTTSKPASTTASTTTLGPSPTAWTELGCYFDDPAHLPLMETRVSAADDALTIAKCQDACYRGAYRFAGVKGGDECWCSPFVGGEWARDQEDCDLPCSGDEREVCGGGETVVVFEDELEEEDDEDESAGGSTTSTTSSGTTSAPTSTPTSGSMDAAENAVDDSPAESKASRNRALIYWRYFNF
jgi:hypothetical protein